MPIYLRVPDDIAETMDSDPVAFAEWRATVLVRVVEAMGDDSDELQHDDPVRIAPFH
jgi:hypothetical protein